MPRGRPDKLDSSKEVAGYHGMEVVQPGLIPAFYPSQQSDLGYLDTVKSCEATPQQQRICGLRKVTFWLVLVLGALTVVVVGASVALGVVLSRSRDNGTFFLSCLQTPQNGGIPCAKHPRRHATRERINRRAIAHIDIFR